jgi:hypothetical protein
MPVILRPEDEEQWLDASRTSFAQARSLLKPIPAELMDAHDVSPIVNSAKYDGPECTRPVSDDEMPRGGQLSLLILLKNPHFDFRSALRMVLLRTQCCRSRKFDLLRRDSHEKRLAHRP